MFVERWAAGGGAEAKKVIPSDCSWIGRRAGRAALGFFRRGTWPLAPPSAREEAEILRTAGSTVVPFATVPASGEHGCKWRSRDTRLFGRPVLGAMHHVRDEDPVVSYFVHDAVSPEEYFAAGFVGHLRGDAAGK